MVCLRNISVDALHKGDTDYDDDYYHDDNDYNNINSNNNNNKTADKISLPPSQFVYNKTVSTSDRREMRLSTYQQIMQNTRRKYENKGETNRRMPIETGCTDR
jgi:hypothetical protein